MTTSSVELFLLLKQAIEDATDRAYRVVERTVAQLPEEANLLNDLERAIDDVVDYSVQAELRRLLGRLDMNRETTKWALENVTLGPALEPVRTIATDLVNGFL